MSLGHSLTLDHTHQVVGRVQAGKEVLEMLNDVGTLTDDSPAQRVSISRCGATTSQVGEGGFSLVWGGGRGDRVLGWGGGGTTGMQGACFVPSHLPLDPPPFSPTPYPPTSPPTCPSPPPLLRESTTALKQQAPQAKLWTLPHAWPTSPP